MVQSINTRAILTLASVLRRPSLLVPYIRVSNVSELNYSVLKNYVDAVVFDKDNTLTAPYENVVHPDAQLGLESALSVFGANRVAILSNSAGTKDDFEYRDAIRIEQEMGINVIRHDEKKPGGLEEVLKHLELDDAKRICMVGDRVLTDVVFGNLYGFMTVHTLPLCEGEENAKDNTIASTVRWAENKLLYSSWGSSWEQASEDWPDASELVLDGSCKEDAIDDVDQ